MFYVCLDVGVLLYLCMYEGERLNCIFLLTILLNGVVYEGNADVNDKYSPNSK